METKKKVAILVANGFEQSELEEPKKALEAKGVKTNIISPESQKVKGWTSNNWGKEFKVDVQLDNANPEDYDLLVLPGGVMNPDKLRMDAKAIAFIKYFADNNMPIAAICHGPWTLIDANAVAGKKITSWPSLRADLNHADAHWVDQEVVRDGNLVTSRKPADLPAFNKKMIEMLFE